MPLPVQNGGQQSFAQLVRSQGQTYQPMQMQPATPMASEPQYAIITGILTGNGTNDYEPNGGKPSRHHGFNKNIPAAAGVEFGVGLQVTGYQRELFGFTAIQVIQYPQRYKHQHLILTGG